MTEGLYSLVYRSLKDCLPENAMLIGIHSPIKIEFTEILSMGLHVLRSLDPYQISQMLITQTTNKYLGKGIGNRCTFKCTYKNTSRPLYKKTNRVKCNVFSTNK